MLLLRTKPRWRSCIRPGPGARFRVPGARRNSEMVSFVLNGTQVTARSEDSTPLLWVIRDELKLTGTKFGCGAALCGACTVHVNGKAVRSCTTPLSSVKGARVTTIEGLAPDSSHPLQKAWIAEEVPQCGYCQSGQILSLIHISEPTR